MSERRSCDSSHENQCRNSDLIEEKNKQTSTLKSNELDILVTRNKSKQIYIYNREREIEIQKETERERERE